MFGFFSDIFKKIGDKFSDAIFEWLEKRYGDSTELILPTGSRAIILTPFQKFIRDLKSFSLPFIAFGLTVAVIFRLGVIYNYRTYLYQLRSDVSNFYYEAIEIKLIALTFLVAILCFLLLGSSRNIYSSRSTLRRYWIGLQVLFLVGVSIFTITPISEEMIFSFVESQAFLQAYHYFDEGNFDIAKDIFSSLAENSVNPELAVEAKGFEVGTDYWNGDFQASVEGYVKLITQDPTQLMPELVQSLHWSIYGLGRELPLQEAENFILEIGEKYPTEELSPVWLGISPKNYEFFISDTVNVWGVADFEDRIKLRLLISKYPNDPYADIGGVLVGEVTDSLLASNLRDWTIYNAGNDAYSSLDFLAAITYFESFLEEFPNHRWAHTSRFLLARSHELNGTYDNAVITLLDSAKLPTNYRAFVDRLYAIALIDFYFDSNDIKEFISSKNLGQDDLSLLEYCLAEQLFKEGSYEEAARQFNSIQIQFPDSLEAEFVPHNLNLLDEIMEQNNNPSSNSALKIARIFMSEPYNFDHESFVIYNDLYQGNRNRTISQIGLFGPDSDYIQETNDQIIAGKMLEDFSHRFPDSPQVPEALYLATLAYYHLSYPYSYSLISIGRTSSFLGNIETPNQEIGTNSSHSLVLSELERLSQRLLSEYPNSGFTPEALTLTGIGFESFERLDKTVEYMQLVVNLYPSHHLANNALIYIARSYSKLAASEQNPTLQIAYLRFSETAYEKVLNDYPSGHVGSEARIELSGIKQQLILLQGS